MTTPSANSNLQAASGVLHDPSPSARDLPVDLTPLTRVFNRAWAIATLFDKAWYGHWAYSPTNFCVAAAALLLLARPESGICLVVLCLAQVADYFSESTVMGNHTFIMIVVDAMILLASGQLAWRGEWRAPEAARIFRMILVPLRWNVLFMYGWATLHKLNTDFLNPDTSCVSLLMYDARHRSLVFSLFHPPAWMLQAGIHGTLVIEAVIPLFLVFRRTRSFGLLLAFGFHSLLSFGPRNGFYAFSVVAFPLLFAFVDPGWGARLEQQMARLVWPQPGDWRGWLGRLSALLVLALLSVFSRRLGISRVCPAWFTYDALLLAFVFSDWRNSGRQALATREPHPLAVSNLSLLCLSGLFFLNGLSPYLGLKTETSFAMYSNLRTEGNRPNHLFFPGWMSIFPEQQDLVEVLDCSVPELRQLADRKLQLPFFELCSELSTHPEASLLFRRGAEVHDISRVGDRRDLLPEIPLWKRRLFPFRALEPSGAQGCRH
jgi:hypothetical protein